MLTGAMLPGRGTSTQVPGAGGAEATDPSVDNILFEAKLSFHWGWFKSFPPNYQSTKRETEISID